MHTKSPTITHTDCIITLNGLNAAGMLNVNLAYLRPQSVQFTFKQAEMNHVIQLWDTNDLSRQGKYENQ